MKVIGNGSVVPREDKPKARCRVWQLQVLVDDHGERRRLSETFHGTWTQARAALAEWRAELESSEPAPRSCTVSEYMDMWHARRERSGAFSDRTLRTDMEKLAPVRMMLGERLVSSVKRDDVRSVLSGAMDGKTPSGREWSPHSVSRMRTALGKMMRDAVSDGYAVDNPVEGAECPKRPASSGSAMPAGDMDALLSSLDWTRKGHRAVGLALGCGLRRSEICALRWEDVRDGCVHVRRSVGEDGSDRPTKSGAGVRTVPLPPVVAAGLESARADGKVVDMLPHSLSAWWRKRRAGLGCRGYRFHDLRHSYATRLAASGVHVRVMMELCGWSSVDVAMRVYTHVSDSMREDAVAAAFGIPCSNRAAKEKDGEPSRSPNSPSDLRFRMVGDTGFEPVAPAV